MLSGSIEGCDNRMGHHRDAHHSFEIARVLVRLDHLAALIVNANHGVRSWRVLQGFV
jgi:hypothetical protein